MAPTLSVLGLFSLQWLFKLHKHKVVICDGAMIFSARGHFDIRVNMIETRSRITKFSSDSQRATQRKIEAFHNVDKFLRLNIFREEIDIEMAEKNYMFIGFIFKRDSSSNSHSE